MDEKMNHFGGVSSQFLNLMREGGETLEELPRDDLLVALTHRAYPAVVEVIDAIISGKRRIQVFDCAEFLFSPSAVDYERALRRFERLLRGAMRALRTHLRRHDIPTATPPNFLVRCSSQENVDASIDEPVVTFSPGACKDGYEACVTGLPIREHFHFSLLVRRSEGTMTCQTVANPGKSPSTKKPDFDVFRILLERAKDGVIVVLVRNETDAEDVAAATVHCGWRAARVTEKNREEESVSLGDRTVVVWNTTARGWLTHESAQLMDACTLSRESQASRCFALLYECEAKTWVPRALGQIVGPKDDRRYTLAVTFFR